MNDGRKTMVFITPCTPDIKGVGWEQRAFSFLESYAKLYRVTLLVQCTNDDRNLKRLQKALDIVDTAFTFDERFFLYDKSLIALFTKVLKAASLVHVFRLPRLLQHITHPQIIWDIDELPSPLRDPRRNTGHPSPTPDSVSKMLQLYEQCWKKAKVVIASSPEEVHQSLGQPVVVPNVVPLGSKRELIPRNKELLFVGNLNKKENLAGLKFFIEKCMRHLLPGSTLTVVGRSPKYPEATEFMRSVSALPYVKVFCDVESCEPFYNKARLVIVPLQQGAGTKLKLLEALSQYCPVVTTTKGAEGLQIVDGEEALIRDNPKDFADACNKLLNSDELSMKLAACGYLLVKTHYSQQIVDSLIRDMAIDIRGNGGLLRPSVQPQPALKKLF